MSSCANAPHHHLVVLQHGNHGKAEDLLLLQQELHEILEKDVASEDMSYHYLRPKSNEGNRTHDGIETLAARVVIEIDEYIAQNIHSDGCIYLTMVAHSLGMARACRSHILHCAVHCNFFSRQGPLHGQCSQFRVSYIVVFAMC